MKRKLMAMTAAMTMVGTLGFVGPAGAVVDDPPPPPKGCQFPPGGQVAPLNSDATPGGMPLVNTICSNAGRGEGNEFQGRGGNNPDIDPGGSGGNNNGGD